MPDSLSSTTTCMNSLESSSTMKQLSPSSRLPVMLVYTFFYVCFSIKVSLQTSPQACYAHLTTHNLSWVILLEQQHELNPVYDLCHLLLFVPVTTLFVLLCTHLLHHLHGNQPLQGLALHIRLIARYTVDCESSESNCCWPLLITCMFNITCCINFFRIT